MAMGPRAGLPCLLLCPRDGELLFGASHAGRLDDCPTEALRSVQFVHFTYCNPVW